MSASYLIEAISLLFLENSLRRRTIDESLVSMLAHDLQPASMVEDRGFLAFLEAIDPKYTPPSRHTIMRVHLPAMKPVPQRKS